MLATLTLTARTPLQFYVVYCSVGLPCSNSLPCGEDMAPRFRWDTL